MLEELEAHLFQALRSDAEGHASDATTMERTAKITKATRELMLGLDRAKAETVTPDFVAASQESTVQNNATSRAAIGGKSPPYGRTGENNLIPHFRIYRTGGLATRSES